MADPVLTRDDVRTDETEAAFALIADILARDDELGRLVKTWRAWDGNPNDAAPPQLAEMPWVRLTPIDSPMRSEAVDHYAIDLTILVEIATAGTHRADQLNLWGAVRRALNFNRAYAGTTVGQAVRALPVKGVIAMPRTPRFGTYRPPPATPGAPGSSEPTNLLARATITVSLDIDSID